MFHVPSPDKQNAGGQKYSHLQNSGTTLATVNPRRGRGPPPHSQALSASPNGCFQGHLPCLNFGK